jgi:hypothetical protein
LTDKAACLRQAKAELGTGSHFWSDSWTSAHASCSLIAPDSFLYAKHVPRRQFYVDSLSSWGGENISAEQVVNGHLLSTKAGRRSVVASFVCHYPSIAILHQYLIRVQTLPITLTRTLNTNELHKNNRRQLPTDQAIRRFGPQDSQWHTPRQQGLQAGPRLHAAHLAITQTIQHNASNIHERVLPSA